MKDLVAFAKKINKSAQNYQMGQFQEIRKQIHGLPKVKTHEILLHRLYVLAGRFIPEGVMKCSLILDSRA
jgi:hypothetical protein